mgnify:CR=1 FL=1
MITAAQRSLPRISIGIDHAVLDVSVSQAGKTNLT